MVVTYEYKEIPLDLIDRDEEQPRKTFPKESIEKLAVSIKREGLTHAPTVKLNPKQSGRFMLVAGERRLRALRLLNVEAVECKVLKGNPRTYTFSLVENLHRENLNPIDEALAYKRLREEEGMSWQEIEELTGRDVQTIKFKLQLLKLPQEIQEMIQDDKLPQVSALNLAQYRGPRGELIRLAYDILLGRTPLELITARFEDQKKLDRGDAIIAGRMPTEPEKIFRKILDWSWRSRSGAAALQAFLELPEEVRTMVLRDTRLGVRAGLLANIQDIIEASQAFVESTLKAAERELLETTQHSPQTETARIPAPPAEQEAQRLPAETKGSGFEPADVLSKLQTIFPSLKRTKRPYLSRSAFVRAWHLAAPEAEQEARRVLGVMRLMWLYSPNGDEKVDSSYNELVRLISNLRSVWEVRTFHNFILLVTRADTSSDPINVKNV